MASTGNVFPTVGASVDRAGSTLWTNPGNVTADDATSASCNTVPSDYLVCSGFGFSLPVNAVITGVTVRIEASETGSGSSNYIPQLISDTTPTLIGAAKGAITITTGPTISTSGGTTDVWGANLTVALVNSAGFGVAIWSTDTTNVLNIDFVTVAIEYVVPTPLSMVPTRFGPFLPPRRFAASQSLPATAPNDIVAAGSLSITGAADLDATGTLAAAGSVSITGAADLDSSGTLVAAGSLSITGAADLDAAGELVAAGSVVITGSADLTSEATLSAVGSLSITGAAGLNAVGELAAAGSLSITGAADLAAAVILVSSLPTRLGPFIPPRRGVGSQEILAPPNSVAAAGTVTITGAADLDATGSLAATGSLSISGFAPLLSGPPPIVGREIKRLGPFFLLFRRSTMAAKLEQPAAGSIVAAGSLSITGAADLDAVGGLAAAGTVSITGAADLDATGQVAAAGSLTISGAASLTGSVNDLVAVGSISITGVAAASATGALAAAGSLSINGSASLTEAGNPNIVAAGSLSISGAAALNGAGRLDAVGSLAVTGAADLDARGEIRAVGSLLISGSADLDARGTLSAAGQIQILGAALLVDANAAVGYLFGTVSVRPALAAGVRVLGALSGEVVVRPEDE